MPTTPDDIQVAITNARHHLDGCEARGAEAARLQAEADRILKSFPPVEAGRMAKTKLAVLQAEADVEAATARYAECARIVGVAHRQWSELVGAARWARHEARLQQAQAALEPVVACLDEDRRDHDAVCATLGLAQGAGEHPVTVAAHLRAVLDTHLRRLHPPPPPPPSPVPAGMTRIRVRKPFWDHDHAYGLKQEVGNTYNMRNEFVREALEQQLVEVVEP